MNLTLTEADVAKQVRDLLVAHGFMMIRLQSGTLRYPFSERRVTLGEKGLPDWVALRPMDRPIFVEVKRPGGRRSKDQINWHAWAQDAGYIVLTISDVRELQNALKTI